MDPRSKGRARGRARQDHGGQDPRQGAPRPGPPQRGPRPGPSQAAAPQGAWNRPPNPQPVQQPQAAWVRPQMPPAAAASGRGSRQERGVDEAVSDPPRGLMEQGQGEADGAGRGGGNGGVRGRTLRNEIIHTRPSTVENKKGQAGSPIELSANYFKVLQNGRWSLYQYRVDFNPEIDNTGQKKGLLRTALQERMTGFLFDGTVMYTPHKVNPDPLEVFVKLNETSEENVRITIRLVGDVKEGDRHYIQLFNIIVRKCLHYMKLQLVGRNYYDPTAKVTIPEHRIELWPGYYTSMRQHESADILLNCDVTNKVMRMDNVYDLLLECCNGPNMRREFQSKIIGSIVLTYYNNKTYRIDDVDFDSNPGRQFGKKDGSQITFIQYFRERYNINIQVDSQPMLVSRSRPREIRAGMPETVYLVPELCKLTGLTDKQRENFQLMRAMADHTRVAPPQRIQKLMQFSQRLKKSPEVLAELKRWDLGIADSLIRFPGRVLPQETIIGGKVRDGNKRYSAGPQADWTKELRNTPMFTVGELKKFAVITPVKFKGSCFDFIDLLKKAAKGMSWEMGNPKIFEIPDDRSMTYLLKIDEVMNFQPNMIMCIVPNQSADRYCAIKKKGCVDRGVPTQVMLAKNLSSKGAMSIATKVAIQLNCKVGGAPWSVVVPLSGLMVVGYDVCRDTANKNMSFGGMVASLDKQLTRYFSYTSEHRYEEELSNNFAASLLLACQKWKEHSGAYPERILIYRDGVGDGQIEYVFTHEVENIKKRLTEEIYTNDNLRMTFVVVSKRINTRIFTARSENPPPGTVVDDVITLPYRYDFFIVSQCVRQGTVSPTNYNVIADNMGFAAEKLQILTYKLCHMYYNWSGTVRVPAPCQYAHKLAFLTAQSLHRSANRQLETTLYYL